ncbi:MAG: OmpA-like protein, partial [Bacteroidota bacterium]|nr:OmpA-like protein [Bacteroidota bacterium]
YYVFDNFSLNLGFNLGYQISGAFEQKEAITKPADKGVFVETMKKTRNEVSGDLTDLSALNLSVGVGAGYDLPLNSDKSLILTPEINYNYTFTNFVSGISWKADHLRFGLAVRYLMKLGKAPKVPEREEMKLIETDTIIAESKDVTNQKYIQGIEIYKTDKVYNTEDKIITTKIYHRTDTLLMPEPAHTTLAFNVSGIYPGKPPAAINEIDIKQQFVTQAFNMMPYIFFESKSSEIPDKYIRLRNTENFKADELNAKPMVFLTNLLNIIGERMNKIPSSKITIAGYADPTTEGGDCSLAKARAESVKNYLVNSWKISPDRLNIETGTQNCQPDFMTVTKNEYGYSENRRCEITANNPDVFAPITKVKYLETTDLLPPEIELTPELSSAKNIRNWTLRLSQGYQTLYEVSGSGKPTAIRKAIDDDMIKNMVSGEQIKAKISINQDDGNTLEVVKELNVTKDTSDIEVQRLSLALFKVSGVELREIDKSAIRNFIKGLKPTDSISVAGYTDFLGNTDNNLALSGRRAGAVCDFIGDFLKSSSLKSNIIMCKGFGSTKKPPQISSQESPEERFLSRTVQIEIHYKFK